MRLLYFGNNWLGWKVLDWLAGQGENVVGLVMHPTEKRKYGEEILKCADLDPKAIIDGSQLQKPENQDIIQKLQPDIGVSVLFAYILERKFIQLFPKGCINLHPAFLPYNRGRNANIWSIVEGRPAGVTLHYIDDGIDTGDIIAQQEVPVDITDTGETLYRKLELAALDLFKMTWPLIRAGEAPRKPQDKSQGNTHEGKDVDQIDEIKLDHNYRARDLINILRARTFPPYAGAYFRHEGKKIHLRIHLTPENPGGKLN